MILLEIGVIIFKSKLFCRVQNSLSLRANITSKAIFLWGLYPMSHVLVGFSNLAGGDMKFPLCDFQEFLDLMLCSGSLLGPTKMCPHTVAHEHGGKAPRGRLQTQKLCVAGLHRESWWSLLLRATGAASSSRQGSWAQSGVPFSAHQPGSVKAVR